MIILAPAPAPEPTRPLPPASDSVNDSSPPPLPAPPAPPAPPAARPEPARPDVAVIDAVEADSMTCASLHMSEKLGCRCSVGDGSDDMRSTLRIAGVLLRSQCRRTRNAHTDRHTPTSKQRSNSAVEVEPRVLPQRLQRGVHVTRVAQISQPHSTRDDASRGDLTAVKHNGDGTRDDVIARLRDIKAGTNNQHVRHQQPAGCHWRWRRRLGRQGQQRRLRS